MFGCSVVQFAQVSRQFDVVARPCTRQFGKFGYVAVIYVFFFLFCTACALYFNIGTRDTSIDVNAISSYVGFEVSNYRASSSFFALSGAWMIGRFSWDGTYSRGQSTSPTRRLSMACHSEDCISLTVSSFRVVCILC